MHLHICNVTFSFLCFGFESTLMANALNNSAVRNKTCVIMQVLQGCRETSIYRICREHGGSEPPHAYAIFKEAIQQQCKTALPLTVTAADRREYCKDLGHLL